MSGSDRAVLWERLDEPGWETIRLALPVGASHDVEVAWVAEEDLAVTRSLQRYTRIGDHAWSFEDRESGFAADLQVDDDGLVLDYPGLFRRLA